MFERWRSTIKPKPPTQKERAARFAARWSDPDDAAFLHAMLREIPPLARGIPKMEALCLRVEAFKRLRKEDWDIQRYGGGPGSPQLRLYFQTTSRAGRADLTAWLRERARREKGGRR